MDTFNRRESSDEIEKRFMGTKKTLDQEYAEQEEAKGHIPSNEEGHADVYSTPVETFFNKYPSAQALRSDKIIEMFASAGAEAGLSYTESAMHEIMIQLNDWQQALPEKIQKYFPSNLRDLEMPQMDITLEHHTVKNLATVMKKIEGEALADDKAFQLLGRLSTLSVAAENLRIAHEAFEKILEREQAQKQAKKTA